MRALLPEEEGQARWAFDAVFCPDRLGQLLLAERIAERQLLYPIDYTMLGPGQFAAVAAGADAVGGSEAFRVALGPTPTWGDAYDRCTVDLDVYESYKRDESALVLEHALYSQVGEWGVVTSDVGCAWLGGSRVFMAAVHQCLPADPENAALSAFVRHMYEWASHGARVDWVKPLLTNIYGPDTAALFDSGCSGS